MLLFLFVRRRLNRFSILSFILDIPHLSNLINCIKDRQLRESYKTACKIVCFGLKCRNKTTIYTFQLSFMNSATLSQRKFLFAGLSISVLLITVLIVWLGNRSQLEQNSSITKDTVIETNQNNDSDIEIEEEMDQSDTISQVSGYSFVNESEFELRKYSDLNFKYCYNGETLPYIPIDLDLYVLRPKDGLFDSLMFYVQKNTSQYVDNSSVLQKSVEINNRILTDQVTLVDSEPLLQIQDAFPGSCSERPKSMKVALNRKIDYEGTESARLIVFYGSYQSQINQNNFPMQFVIVSKIEDNYGLFQTTFNYSDFTKSNSLESCEIISSEYGYRYIDQQSEESHQCVLNAIQKDLDEQKLENIISEFKQIYQLKDFDNISSNTDDSLQEYKFTEINTNRRFSLSTPKNIYVTNLGKKNDEGLYVGDPIRYLIFTFEPFNIAATDSSQPQMRITYSYAGQEIESEECLNEDGSSVSTIVNLSNITVKACESESGFVYELLKESDKVEVRIETMNLSIDQVAMLRKYIIETFKLI